MATATDRRPELARLHEEARRKLDELAAGGCDGDPEGSGVHAALTEQKATVERAAAELRQQTDRLRPARQE